MKKKKGTKITLYYNFNEMYHEGREGVYIKKKNYPFDVILDKKELEMSVKDIYDLYKQSALEQVAYDMMSDYGDFILTIED